MKKLRRQYGFSLTEMLVAVAILLVLIGALLAFGKHLRRQGQETLCRTTIGILVAAIEQYHDFHDAFPAVSVTLPPPLSPSESLYFQLQALPQSRALCEQVHQSLIGDNDRDGRMEFWDPWKTPLNYSYLVGQTFPKIISVGPDKTPNTSDDITSK